MDTNTAHVISQQVLESTAQDMTGKYVWMFVAGLIILMFKSSIEKLAAALFMFIGSDYKEDDVVYVDGKPGRIVRVGLTKTVFFIYDIIDGFRAQRACDIRVRTHVRHGVFLLWDAILAMMRLILHSHATL